MSVTRRGFLAMLGAAGVLAACGGDSGGAASSADEASATDGAGDAPPEAGGTTPTVLALGEEYLLADLLALRIRPMASTANVVLDDGFAGLDEFDTDGIVALPSTEPNLELLADYRADVVVANTFVTDYLGRDLLEGVGGELVVVPDTLLAIGFTLRPGAADVEGEEGGRLYLSNEQIGLLDADTLVALQSDLVAGEPEALDDIADDPLWSELPAVVSGTVVTIDRLGYPGIAGRRRLVEDLVAELG